MPCSIQILYVNGIVPLGGTNPSQVRVMGRAMGCPGGNVEVKTSVSGTSSVTVPVDPISERFAATLSITASPAPACNDPIVVEAWCQADPTCKVPVQAQQQILKCCEITGLIFDSVLPPGVLTPSQMRVQGILLGCSGDQVRAQAFDGSTGAAVTSVSPPTGIDPITGAFLVILPFTSNMQCDQKVSVKVWCNTQPGCFIQHDGKLDCGACPRAQVSASYGSCIGAPAKQQITLNATISIPAGQMLDFYWDYGDGSVGPQFTVNNTGGSAANQYPITDPGAPHEYAPGSYTARLKVVPPSECPEISLQITAQCADCCPTVTLAPPVVSGCAASSTVASFTATLSWPSSCTPTQPAAYVWTLNGSTGQFQKITSTNTTDTSTGWTKLGVTPTQVGPVDLSQPGSYSITVSVQITGIPLNCYPIGTAAFSVFTCTCPSLTGLTANPASGTTPLAVSFQAGVTNPGAIVPDAQGNLYHWDFGDGTTADTATPNTTHTYTNAGTFATTVTVNVPSGCPATAKSTSVTVTQPPACPSLTGLTASPSSGAAPLAVNFQASVTNPGAIVPDAQGNLYHWNFGDGTTAHTPTPNTSHTYAGVGSFAATVTVNVPTGCPATAASTSLTAAGPTTPPPTGGGFNLCAALLILAVALLLIGALVVIVGVCINVPWVWIAGAIIGALGLLLFIAWIIFCAATTPCSIMRTVHCVLFWIIAVVAPIIVVIAAIFGGLPCALAAAGSWGGWGTLYAWLGFVMRSVRCPPTC